MVSYWEEKRLAAEGDGGRLLLAKNKKKEFNYLMSAVLLEQQKHLLASLHFKGFNNHFLFLPSIGLTLASATLALFAQSQLVSPYNQMVCTISVAIVAAFSVFWQSLMKQLDYGGRAMLHDSTATALGNILKNAEIKRREQKMKEVRALISTGRSEQSRDGPMDLELAEGIQGTRGLTSQDGGGDTPSEDATSKKPAPDDPVAGDGDHSTLARQFEQAVQGCTSVVPINISAAFHALDTRVNVRNKKLVPTENANPKIAWEMVFPALYHQLTLTIIGSKMWPYFVPGANWAVNKAIKDFQNLDAGLMKGLVERTHEIDKEYSSFASTEAGRTQDIDREYNSLTTPVLHAEAN